MEHCLLANPGVKKGDIRKVYSHPQALAQCDNYLRSQGMEPEARGDTAGSAQWIKGRKMGACAAIACVVRPSNPPPLAARRHRRPLHPSYSLR